jgi:hypothetical protein
VCVRGWVCVVQVIQALNAELQSVKKKNDEQQLALKSAEEKLSKSRDEMELLKVELTKAESKKPSQVLETLVIKLKKQLADKKEKQEAMKQILELREEMLKAADSQASELAAKMMGKSGEGVASGDDAVLAEQSAKLKQQVDDLQGKYEKLRSKQKEVQKQLDDERERCKTLEKDKEALENTLRTQTTDLRKAQRQAREVCFFVTSLYISLLECVTLAVPACEALGTGAGTLIGDAGMHPSFQSCFLVLVIVPMKALVAAHMAFGFAFGHLVCIWHQDERSLGILLTLRVHMHRHRIWSST